jgi:hypothetical protein
MLKVAIDLLLLRTVIPVVLGAIAVTNSPSICNFLAVLFVSWVQIPSEVK